MKVLSVKNPYSFLICHGIKDVENRIWQTNYRGELLIHSCGKIDYSELFDCYIDKKTIKEIKNLNKIKDDAEAKATEKSKLLLKYFDLGDLAEDYLKQKNEYYFKSGYIIGKVNLIDIVKNSKSPFAEKGQYHWILEKAELFKNPIQTKGQLNLWNYNL